MFDGYDVTRLLGTANTFEGMGVDYLPAVKEVRAALDEPASVPKPSFHCVQLLDAWIQEREKQ